MVNLATLKAIETLPSSLASQFVGMPSPANSKERRQYLLEKIYSKDGLFAKWILSKLDYIENGPCKLCTLKPYKKAGYIQISIFGANKIMTLGSLLCAVKGERRKEGQHVSHLCNQPACLIPEHVTLESCSMNNSRKGCPVYVRCRHCKKKNYLCNHKGLCIKYKYKY